MWCVTLNYIFIRGEDVLSEFPGFTLTVERYETEFTVTIQNNLSGMKDFFFFFFFFWKTKMKILDL